MALSRTNRGTKTLAWASQSTNTLTSNSFTPTAGSMILVIFHEITSDATPSLTLSSTLSGMGSWTQDGITLSDGFGSLIVTRYAWAICGATPGTGTVTVTRRAGTFNMGMFVEFIQINGQKSSPIRQSVKNTQSSGTSLALNFGSSVLSSSYIFSGVHDSNSTDPTVPSGHTALGNFTMVSGSFRGRNSEKLGSGAQNNSWTALGGFMSTGIILEIEQAVAVAATGRLFAAGHSRATAKHVAPVSGRQEGSAAPRATARKAAPSGGRATASAAPRGSTKHVYKVGSRLVGAAFATESHVKKSTGSGRLLAAAGPRASTVRIVPSAGRIYVSAAPWGEAGGSLYSSTLRSVIGRLQGAGHGRVTAKKVLHVASRSYAGGAPRGLIVKVTKSNGSLAGSGHARLVGVKKISSAGGRSYAGGWLVAYGGRFVPVAARLYGGGAPFGYPILQQGPPPPPPQLDDPIVYTSAIPPAALLEQFFASGVVRIRRRIDIYEFDGETEWMMDAPLVGGSISVDAQRDERRLLDLVLDNGDRALDGHPEGFWYDKIIKVYWGIETNDEIWETQLGEFMIDSVSSQNFPYTIGVHARDFAKKLIIDKFAVATLFSKGSGVADVIKAIASGNTTDPLVGVSKFNLDDDGKKLAVDVLFERQTSRWEAIQKIAESYGLEVFFDRYGFLTLRPFRDPVASATVMTFKTGSDGNLASYRKNADDSRLVNHFTVTGSANDSGIPAYGEAINTEPSSPTRISKIGRRSDGIDNALLTSSAECRDLAIQYLKVAGLESYNLEMDAINAPWIEVGEAVEFIDPRPEPGAPKRFYLTNLDIPLELAPMSATAKRVQVVGGTSGVWENPTPPDDPDGPPSGPDPDSPPVGGTQFEAETAELFAG